MRRGIAHPRFPVRVEGQILEQGEPVPVDDDDAVGRALLSHWDRDLTMEQRNGIWTLTP